MTFVINNPTLSGYIRERIVQVVAIAIKRQSIDDLGEDRRLVLTEVSNLITGKFYTPRYRQIRSKIGQNRL